MTATDTVDTTKVVVDDLAKVELTDSAVAHILDYANKHKRNPSIRIGVKTASCSAHSYIFELEETINDDDSVFDCKGVRLIIDPKSMVFLAGMHIDYKKEGLQEGFEFTNPNVKGTCGCGKSFTV